MTGIKGYILTREHRKKGRHHSLRYTGVCDQGPFEVVITRDRPVFFIERSAVLPANCRVHRRRQVELTSFGGTPVDALYFTSQPGLYSARTLLADAGITTYESDILPEDRYLMERFINGGVEIQGKGVTRGGMVRFTNPIVTPAAYRPGFCVMSLDIETGQRGELYSIACHTTGHDAESVSGLPPGLVLMLDPKAKKSSASPRKGTPKLPAGFEGAVPEPLSATGWMVRLPGEKQLLTAFVRLMEILDPDILIGWHVVGFDLVFLDRKYRQHGIPFTLGRNRQRPELREIRKGVYGIDISGRIVIDGPPTLRGAFYSFDNFRLETVAESVLGHGKDIGEDQDKVAEIERRFREDKTALARYNLLDCTLVSDIFRETGLIDLTWKRARISGLPMDRVGRSVAAFDHFMLPKIHRHGLVAPNIKDITDAGNAPGGWVFTKSPGFFDNIAVFDFKSLYPSIIRTFNIDPLSRLTARKNPEAPHLNTPVGITYSREIHVLPEFITTLMDTRDRAKQEKDPHLSQAVKILMNSFYGVMGTTKSRFYNPELSRSITGTGRWLLKTTRQFLEDRGYAVLYGDTDSVFVQLKPDEAVQGENAAKQLAQEINTFLTRTIRDAFDLESRLEMEFEKLFTRFFLPALRGGGDSAKKRYAGIITRKGKTNGDRANEDQEELVFTGLEFVRSDWTRFARQFQYDLFHRVFHDREVASWIRQTILDLKAGRHDKDLAYRKRLTKSADAYIKAVPPHVRAARLLNDDNLREISYIMTLRGPIPVQLPHDDPDYAHYIDKQLKPIADAVLRFFDLSVTEIMGGKQLSLF
ncbi:MAG TPA: DNA polymerase II [Desulfobacteraceae bacterium]|nr:DNA polymerase II [Desulfobacteraceae bacterium]